MALKPQMIGIAGESGVGKSTIAEIITLFFGVENTTIISTDDLHKWDRHSKNWESFTHLNPEANNLELGDVHTTDLANGKSIYRSKYSHETGYFEPPIKVTPSKIVIVEGLHAFYTDTCKDILDLKIFIDTDEELRTHWKIIRDTEERGYKYNVVLDTINKRKNDSLKIKSAQINVADVIIKITPKNKILCLGDKSEKINLTLSISFMCDEIFSELFNFIKNYNDELNKFIIASDLIGNDIELCQHSGGNISAKISDQYMIIKSSGFSLKDMYKSHSYSVINYKSISDSFENKEIKNDAIFNEKLKNIIYGKRPSMETGFHVFLDKYVIHTHPVYLTLLLCLKNSKSIINNLYSKYEFNYIDYHSPGLMLSRQIRNCQKKEIYFLENHGMILSVNNMSVGLDMLRAVNDVAEQFIIDNCKFEKFNISYASFKHNKHYTFPDSVIFLNDESKKEIIAAHNYISIIGAKIGKIRYLTSNQVNHLKNLEAEKYRKTL